MVNRVALVANMLVGIDALRIHPLRTLLSVLGITIGSAALVATMAVSDGLMDFARVQVQRQTSVQVIVISSRTAAYEDGKWVGVHDYPIFGAEDAEALRAQVDGLQAVTMVLSGSSFARYRGVQHRVQVSLGTADMPAFGVIDVAAGRFFSAMEVANNTPVVVVNHALARDLAPGRDPLSLVGHEIHVRNRVRRVVGVLAPAPFEDRENPAFVLMAPLGAARALLEAPANHRFTPAIELLAPTVESVGEVREAVVDWLSRRYARWHDRVTVTVGLEALTQVEQAFLLLKCFVGALVGISLLVGGIGIMNVLLASVAERTREIGIRKSVGARSSDIRAQFLTESVAIALAGTAVGLLVGLAIALVVTVGFRLVADVPIYPVLSLTSVLVATLSSSIVGLAFGTYPARRAASLPPVVAIAHEP